MDMMEINNIRYYILITTFLSFLAFFSTVEAKQLPSPQYVYHLSSIIIKDYEKLYLKPKRDIDGKYILGYGDKKCAIKYKKYKSISMYQAETCLKEEISRIYNHIHSIFPCLRYNQTIALIVLEYNVGKSAFRKSKLVQAIKKKQYKNIKKEWLSFYNHKHKGQSGLKKRREFEYQLFIS
jgi:GH24 family phage-related lysozyme (muramidase)